MSVQARALPESTASWSRAQPRQAGGAPGRAALFSDSVQELAAEVGITGEIHAQPPQASLVTGGGHMRHVHVAAL